MGGNTTSKNPGLKLLLDKLRREFRIAENLNHYSEENYKIAERKYLKFALSTGEIKDYRE